MLIAYITLNYNKSASHFDLHLQEWRPVENEKCFQCPYIKIYIYTYKKIQYHLHMGHAQCIYLSVDAIFRSLCFLSEIPRKRVVVNKEATETRVLVVKLKSPLRTLQLSSWLVHRYEYSVLLFLSFFLSFFPFFLSFFVHVFLTYIADTMIVTVGTETTYHSGTPVFISGLLGFALLNLKSFVQRFVDYRMSFCLFNFIVLSVLLRLRAWVAQWAR